MRSCRSLIWEDDQINKHQKSYCASGYDFFWFKKRIHNLFSRKNMLCCNLPRLLLCFILTSKEIAMEGNQDILFPKKGPLNLNHLVSQLHKIGDPRILFSPHRERSVCKERRKKTCSNSAAVYSKDEIKGSYHSSMSRILPI